MQTLEDFMAAAKAETGDPAEQLIAFVRRFEEGAAELTAKQPGCLFVSFVYEHELAAPGTEEIIAATIRAWRIRVLDKLEQAAEAHPPPLDVDLPSLADPDLHDLRGRLRARPRDERPRPAAPPARPRASLPRAAVPGIGRAGGRPGRPPAHGSGRSCQAAGPVTTSRRPLPVRPSAPGGNGSASAGRAHGHFGLAIMRERARAQGGECEIGPRPEGGTRLVLRMPVR
jgi:hypothetical protein